MTNPREKCPSRNITCAEGQHYVLFNEFEQSLLKRLLDGTIEEIPKKRRWKVWRTST